MTFADLLLDLRVELSDSDITEWENAELMTLAQRATKRLHQLVILHQLQFAESSFSFQIVAGQAHYLLPADFDTQHGLFRGDTGRQVTLAATAEFETARAPYGAGLWTIRGTDIYLLGDMAENVTMTLYYIPVHNRTYDLQDEVPFGLKVWDVLVGYAALLAKNIDEMNVETDALLLADVEQQVLTIARRNMPQVAHLEGLE